MSAAASHVWGGIVTRGGTVLWESGPMSSLRSPNPVDVLFRDSLLASATLKGPSGSGSAEGDGTIAIGTHDVSHSLLNDRGLVFVVVTPRVLNVSYGGRLSQVMRAEWAKLDGAAAEFSPGDDWPERYAVRWGKMLEAFADRAGETRKPAQQQQQSGKKKGNNNNSSDAGKNSSRSSAGGKGAEASGDGDGSGSDGGNGDEDEDEGARKARKLAEARAAMRRKVAGGGGGGDSAPSSPKTPTATAAAQSPKQGKKGGKDKRSWDGKAANRHEAAALDFSDDKGASKVRGTHDPSLEAPIDLDDFGLDETTSVGGASGTGGVMGYFRKLVGNRPLERDDLKEPLEQLKSKLMSKNVAPEIAGKLCGSVLDSLVGTHLSTFGSAAKTLEAAMESALTTVLTPKRSVDILREIADARKERKLYTIVFVGVNGVGKSTSLSKTCFWLLQNKLKVMIAACDTFRAGAVEQLAEHCRRLDVPLFQKGYGKDAAAVAREGVEHATQQGMDVLLIDTAGRMQGNEPLMRSLAKLVSVNRPDLILFVGEALVGTDGVDQVVEFNRAMNEYSTDKHPRLIDGIFLTKFDTIDEKVGAALSMVYSTGQPVVFVGVGQQYPDLRRMNVKAVVHSLLK